MKIRFVPTGYFKLDGGAMFGVVPRRLWQKLNPPDEHNMCTWALRCLLIETDDDRRILVDTGIGDKQGEKFRSHFEPHGEDSLPGSLQRMGLSPEDITDVFLTHLHFDHVGGAVKREADGSLVPTFPHATYWSNERHYDWAHDPNPRERASFLKENFVPLREAGVLQFLDVTDGPLDWIPGIRIHYLYGHTEAMMALEIDVEGQTYFYAADLCPSVHHVGMPYVMAYDIRPLHTLAEKKRIFERAVEEDWILLFEHGPRIEGARLIRNDRGRIVAGDRGKLEEIGA